MAIRKLFTNQEILRALDNTDSVKEAAKELSELRNVAVSSQLLSYWKKHLELKKRDGQPYVGTTVLDRNIRQDMELRKADPDDYLRKKYIEPDNSCILIIPDQHSPYQHIDALRFLADVADKLNPTRVVNLGDETDGHALSFHDSDPNLDSAGVELHKAREFLHDLEELFPVMDICHSNHGSLVYRRAYKFGIPVEYIKSYRDIIFDNSGGDAWQWMEKITATLPNGDTTVFQHQSSGSIIANAAHERANIVQGHEHGQYTIEYRSSTQALYWAMISGCLIDPKALAFAYGKLFSKKPIIGVSAIVDSQPLLIPMPQDSHGRYRGKLGGIHAG